MVQDVEASLVTCNSAISACGKAFGVSVEVSFDKNDGKALEKNKHGHMMG